MFDESQRVVAALCLQALLSFRWNGNNTNPGGALGVFRLVTDPSVASPTLPLPWLLHELALTARSPSCAEVHVRSLDGEVMAFATLGEDHLHHPPP